MEKEAVAYCESQYILVITYSGAWHAYNMNNNNIWKVTLETQTPERAHCGFKHLFFIFQQTMSSAKYSTLQKLSNKQLITET